MGINVNVEQINGNVCENGTLEYEWTKNVFTLLKVCVRALIHLIVCSLKFKFKI